MSYRELGEKIGNSGLYPASILMYLHDCDRRPSNCEFYYIYTCTCLYIVLRKCGVLLVVASYMQVSLDLQSISHMMSERGRGMYIEE